MDNFRGKDTIEGILTLTDEPANSIVIATPFDKPGHFTTTRRSTACALPAGSSLAERNLS